MPHAQTLLDHSCLEPMHSLTATQCPILSARVRSLKCWKHSRIEIPRLLDRLGRRVCLEQTSWQSGTVLHGAVRTTSNSSMAQVHYNMYTRKLVRIMSLPPTDLNIFVHVHFQMLLWKAGDCQCPLGVSISEYGREIKDGIICPSIHKANCSCHRVKLSCTIYWFCSTGVVCRNSLIKNEDGTGDEEQHYYDHGHDMLTMNRTRNKMTSWMIAI